MMYELESVHGDDYETLASAMVREWDWAAWPDPDAHLQQALQWCYPPSQPVDTPTKL